MKTIIIIALLCNNLVFSQDLKKHQKLDTIYFKFKEGHYYQKKIKIKFTKDIMYFFYGGTIQVKSITFVREKKVFKKA